jgi:hypothetical protein
MCLSCHDNKFKYGLLSADEPREVAEIHSWLPNQQRHLNKIRCVDCHTKVQSDILVAHNILPKEDAVKNCVQCHSSNSVLMESLYAHRAKENRVESGFLNAVVLHEGYILGANRNKFLNYVSIGLFGLVIIGLLVHLILRLILIKKK